MKKNKKKLSWFCFKKGKCARGEEEYGWRRKVEHDTIHL